MSFIRKTEEQIAEFKKRVSENPTAFLPTFIRTLDGKKPKMETVKKIVSDLKNGNW